ncbi:MAG TPA: glycosyl transferase [Tissierellales bacterium]|nr:glycosyl transferase [Tissierellales bacterium]
MVTEATNPTVSVIIPTYNRAHMVDRAIRSVLSQTYQDFELIVADDASTDNTEEVVEGFDDERIRYICHKENSGTSVAPRNTGIKAARGEYIAFLDSDDEWLPGKLEKQMGKFNSVSQDVGLIYSGFVRVDDKTGETRFERMPDRSERGDVFKILLKGDIVGPLTAIVRKECFEKAGTFNEEFRSNQDLDMWLRISRYYKFDFVPEILARYYIHDSHGSRNIERQIQGLLLFMNKYQKYMSKTVVSSRLGYLGMLLAYQGKFKEASIYFKQAVYNKPWDIYNYIRFLLCKFAPGIYQARLMQLSSYKESVKYK